MRIKVVPKDIINRLSVPATVNDSILPFFKPNPTALNEWLDALPPCNMSETGRKILPAMETMNLTRLPGDVRFELTECIRPHVFDYTQQGETALLDASFPLKNTIADSIHYTVNFHQALADAYVSVLVSDAFISDHSTSEAVSNESDDAEVPFKFNELQQATVIHRALQSFSIILLRCAQSYQAEPIHIWDHIHALYSIAESQDIHRMVISDPENQRHRDSTIEDLFKQLHFFNLAAPNRFRQRDIQSILHLLEDCANRIQISDTQGSGDKAAYFFVALSSALPAQHISKAENHDSSYRYFYTQDFVEYLKSDEVVVRSKAELVNLDSDKTQLPARTIHRLLLCWHKISSRQFSRHTENRDVTLYPGLHNIIKKLLDLPVSEKTKGTILRGNKDQKLGSSLAHLELMPTEMDDVHPFEDNLRSELSVKKLLKKPKSSVPSTDIWKHTVQKLETGSTRKVAGKIADSSAKGYKLDYIGDTQALIKVGDLLGISQGSNELEIAVIRHFSSKKEGVLELGVELIAPNAEVARIVNDDDNIRSRSVLLLPGISAIQQPISILSISQLNLPNNQLELMVNEQNNQYQITKLLETNPAYSHYTLQKLDS